MKPRNDDFDVRSKHLKSLSDAELKTYFEKLTDQIVDPLLTLGYDHTTPAIERSVLMRMGFSSIEAKVLTDKMMEHHLLAHGAGHVVYRYAQTHGVSIRDAGMALIDNTALESMVEVFR